MEITQFTYFQQAGSLPLKPVAVEITYGLERILMSLQRVDHFKDIRYNDIVSYGECFMQNEQEARHRSHSGDTLRFAADALRFALPAAAQPPRRRHALGR